MKLRQTCTHLLVLNSNPFLFSFYLKYYDAHLDIFFYITYKLEYSTKQISCFTFLPTPQLVQCFPQNLQSAPRKIFDVSGLQNLYKKSCPSCGQLFEKFYKFPTDYSVMSAYMKYQYPLDACHAPVTLSLMR